MTALILQKIDPKILVIGPVYNKIDKIEKITKLADAYDLVIVNGNLCYPYHDAESRFTIFKEQVFNNPKIIYNIGHHDLLFSRNYPESPINKWLIDKPNIIFLEFSNQSTTIITNGGVTPDMNKFKLLDNTETSFVSQIDGVPWHKKYFGRYGYIVSNNPLSISKPEFYPFSMSMGMKFEEDSKVYAQEIDSTGLHKTILL